MFGSLGRILHHLDPGPAMTRRPAVAIALAQTATISLLAGVAGCAETPAPEQANVSAASKPRTAVPAPRRVAAEAVPVTTTDVSRTRPRPPDTRVVMGPRTRLPLLMPPHGDNSRATLMWRNNRVRLPRDFQVSFATARGAVGVDSGGGDRPSVMSLPWNGSSPSRLWRARRRGYVTGVVPRDGNRLWWSLATYRGDDQVLSWGPDAGVREHPIDPGPRPEPTATQSLSVDGVLSDGDVILSARWEQQVSSGLPTRYHRTSGRPAPWDLENITGVAPRTQLVVGLASGLDGNCLAVHEADVAAASWIRCFERGGRPAEIVSAQFTPSGSRLVVLVRGGHFVGPAAMFHVGRDTLLVLDTSNGQISTRMDHNFDRVVLEDDRHVLFVRHGRPDLGGTDEGPYVATLMRCSLDGSCERASSGLPANTSTGAVSVVPFAQTRAGGTAADWHERASHRHQTASVVHRIGR